MKILNIIGSLALGALVLTSCANHDLIADKGELARLAIMNTAESGIFAADRAISQYAHEIWNVK